MAKKPTERASSSTAAAYNNAETAVRDTVSEIEDAFQEFIRKRPLTALGIAFMAGYIYSMIRR
jgi:hypothetical protein